MSKSERRVTPAELEKGKKKKKNKFPKKDTSSASLTHKPKDKGIRGIIENDSVYAQITGKVEKVFGAIAIEKDIDRLTTLLETRHIRKLSVKEILSDQQTRLIEAELQNTANRTSAVAIKVRVHRANYTIYDSLKKLRKYLQAAYAAELKAEAGTQAERAAILDNALSDYDEYCSQLDMLTEFCDTVIADHDAAGYSLLRITKVLELTSRPS